MRELGRELAGMLRPGDVVILDGPLGAGKTTLTQGIGLGLRVRGHVTSPTFVIARVHPGPAGALLHVDAYRVGTALEVEDLDLDADLDRAVTVIEWGAGKVEGLSQERLIVALTRPLGSDAGAAQLDAEDPAAGTRIVRVHGLGRRWARLDLS